MSDNTLAEIVSTPVSNIEEVVFVMERINAILADDDGLKWFNFLYLEVTKAVLGSAPPNGWEDERWLARLDVVFAGLYFEAIRKWINSPSSAPKSWRVLLDARNRRNLMRLQFALCGMNAHINRDLQIAIVQTGEELGVAPKLNTPQHRDFQHVNGLLESVEAQVKPILAVGIVGEIDKSFGRIDDILAMWSVRKARDNAWVGAEFLLWQVRNNSIARKVKINIADDFASFAGRGLLIPVV
jgi:Family of unknown function (DUF5995)